MVQKRKNIFSKVRIMLYLLAVGFFALIVWETYALSVEYVEIAIEGLPSEFDGFRIAQVSDLHGLPFNPAGREFNAIAESRVDLIVATGDFVHHNEASIERVLPFMKALTQVAPVYAVSGNHMTTGQTGHTLQGVLGKPE